MWASRQGLSFWEQSLHQQTPRGELTQIEDLVREEEERERDEYLAVRQEVAKSHIELEGLQGGYQTGWAEIDILQQFANIRIE